MRLAAYAGTSTVLATAVIIRAFHRRPNFYSASVYLAQSNACVMILTNLILLIVCFGMVGLQRLLYGPLRPIEIEQLYEKAWFAITETCLAMTIFRDEVGGWFLVMFVALLMGKVWGWIGDGRVEVLEQQPPANPRLFHARLTVSLLLSLLFDLSLLRYAVHTVLLMARPNMMVMFAFEFAILAISSSSTTVRYAISLTEAVVIKQQTRAKLEERRQELREAREQERRLNDESAPVDDGELDVDEMDIDVPGWEEKGQWVFYLELVTDFFKLVVYLSFFFILLAFYGLPIHIMRDVFLTLRSFIKRITDFLRYRRATQDMNQRYPDASPEEVVREEVCIICREEMQPWPPNNQAPNANAPAAPAAGNGHAVTARVDERSRAKKLPCGHILHFGCLRSWLERQQICPTCRRPVMVTDRITVGTTPPQAGNPGINVVGEGGQRGEAPRPGVPQAGPGPLAHEANNRARVFNLGPLRFGFGVGQHEFMQNLAHQIHNGRVAEPLPDGLQGLGANAGAQQIGLGFGFGRPQGLANQPAPAQPGSPGSASFQAQIHRLELQIANEVNRLRASVEQLRVIQALQNELVRLRQAGTALTTPALPPPELRPHLVPGQAHVAVPHMPPMGPGHPELPPNMTLPPGWTVLPLVNHRAMPAGVAQQPHTAPSASAASGGSQPLTPTTVPLAPAAVNNGGSLPIAVAQQHPESNTSRLTTSPPGPLDQGDTTGNASTLARLAKASASVIDSPPTLLTLDGDAPEESAGSTVSSPAIPAWGSTGRDSNLPPTLSPKHGGAGASQVETASKNEESHSTSVGPAQAKGKAKAASVEDFMDDST